MNNEFTPSISIIVCAYNEELLLEKSLNSLINQYYPKEKYEIVIIDDDSKDKTAEISKFFVNEYSQSHNIKYKKIKHGGLSVARNKGIIETKFDLIAFIDGDAIADKNWLKNIVVPFKDKSIGIVGGLVENLNVESSFAKFIHDLHYKQEIPNNKYRLSDIIGTNMAYRRDVFKEKGGFYTIFDRRGDESTINKIISQDWKYSIVPSAIVFHERPTTRDWLKMRYQNGFYGFFSNKVVFQKINHKKVKYNLYRFPQLLSKVFNLLLIPTLVLCSMLSNYLTCSLFVISLSVFLRRYIYNRVIINTIRKLREENKYKWSKVIYGIFIIIEGYQYSDIGWIAGYIKGFSISSFNNDLDNKNNIK